MGSRRKNPEANTPPGDQASSPASAPEPMPSPPDLVYDTNGNAPLEAPANGDKNRSVMKFKIWSDSTTTLEVALWENVVNGAKGQHIQY